MARRKFIEFPENVVEYLDKCPLLTDEEREIILNYVYGDPKEYMEQHDITRSGYYKKLKRARQKLMECIASMGVQGVEEVKKASGQSEPVAEEEKGRKKDTLPKTRSDPEKTAISASLKVVGAEAAREATEIVREEIIVGRLFLQKFRLLKEVLGYRDWESFIDDVYRAFMEYGMELEPLEKMIVSRLVEEAMDEELLDRLAKEIEEIEV